MGHQASSGSWTHSSHRERGSAGENIHWAQASPDPPPMRPTEVTKSYYSEIDQCKSPGCYQNGAGHFTALIWKSATHLGCGHAYRGNELYSVCRYKAGEGRCSPNLQDSTCYIQNVLPRSKSP